MEDSEKGETQWRGEAGVNAPYFLIGAAAGTMPAGRAKTCTNVSAPGLCCDVHACIIGCPALPNGPAI